ncbi:MAG: 50S ribosomal protein L9 [Syntrophomonadaceae bacterium]|jgi:large subunit ribosomal protein L9|nr:50S ribosomal protein L9 [Syntrophomonadaceae bacterium]
MKVILIQNVKNLGKEGDVKEVADGYARNYLIPKGLVLEATVSLLKETEEKHMKTDKQKEWKIKQAEEIKEKLNEKNVTIKVKTGGSDKLFGAVTSKEIADAIKQDFKINLDKKKIEIEDSIKHLGEYTVKLKIYPQVQAELKVIVTTQKD